MRSGLYIPIFDELVADVGQLRGDADEAYDFVAGLPAGRDPLPYAEAGATWWLVEFPWEAPSVDAVRGVIREGPAPRR
jgi:hypothetical protein